MSKYCTSYIGFLCYNFNMSKKVKLNDLNDL